MRTGSAGDSETPRQDPITPFTLANPCMFNVDLDDDYNIQPSYYLPYLVSVSKATLQQDNLI